MTRHHQSVSKNNPNPHPLDCEVHLQMPYDIFRGGKKKGLKDAYFVQFEVSWGLKLKYFATLNPKYKLSPYPKKNISYEHIIIQGIKMT